MRRIVVAVGLAALLVTAGCARPTAAEVAGERLEEAGVVAGTTWRLVEGRLDREPLVLLDEHPITMTRGDDGLVEGQSSCNGYAEVSGEDATASDLLFPEVANSGMGCPDDAVMQLEDAYLTAVRETSTATVDDAILTLQGPRSTLVFERDDPNTQTAPGAPSGSREPLAVDLPSAPALVPQVPVGSSWELLSGDVDGEPLELLADRPIRFVRHEDGISGQSACNGYGATLASDEDDDGLFLEVASEAALCTMPGEDDDDNPIMRLEERYLTALDGATDLHVTGSRLELTGPDISLVFDRRGTGGVDLDGSWWIEEGVVDDVPLDVPDGVRVVLVVGSGQFSGQVACNGYAGSTIADGDQVRFEELVTGGEACDERGADLQVVYLEALQRTTTAARNGDRLTLSGDGVKLTFTTEEPLGLYDG